MKEDVLQQKCGGKSWNHLYIVSIVIQSSLQGLMPRDMRRKCTPPCNSAPAPTPACAPTCASGPGPTRAFALVSSPA